VGGGVYMEAAADVAIANGTFLDNASGAHGGALAVAAGCKARVEGCLFRGNQAMFYGGAIYAIGSGSETAAVNCTFDDNYAGPGTTWGAYGGALLIEQAAVLSLTHSVLRGNAAAGAGGALSVYAATAQLADCLLEDNAADWYGGAACITDASVTITGSIIRGNRTDYAGGALAVYGASTVLAADSLLNGNHAGEYGAAIFTEASTALVNCTVAGNTVATTNGVIFVNCGTATLENSIVASNSSGIWPAGWAGAATVSMSHSCVYGNASYDVMDMDDPTGADGNLSLDPRFADPGAGDWRLQPDSPCAEAGDNALAYGTVDLDGNPRILPSLGGTVDMGAYEALRHSPKAVAQALSTLEDTALGVTLTATDADGEALIYALVSSPAHGTLSGSAPHLTYTPAPDYNGSDSFTFSANDGALDSNTATVAITVSAVNDAPVLAASGGKSVDEEAVLRFTVAASDPADRPANGLTCSAAGLPEGATFEPGTGVFTWTPTEAQQGTFAVTFTVTDDGTPSLSASETVTITVAEVNDAPVLAQIGARSVIAGTRLSFTVTASDPNDVPANALTLSAAGLPAGAVFDPASGAFTWLPTEAQGGTTYTVTITVTDDGTNPAAQSDSETFTITVKRDSDGDGLADVDEVGLYGTDPNAADTDNDGLSDGAEVNTYGTDPLSADSDGDGQSDGDEVACGSNPLDGLVLAADTDGDTMPDCSDDDDDGDGLSDSDEVNVYGTDPLDADSDDDGSADGDEVAMLGYSIFGSDSDDALHIEEFAEIEGNAVGVGKVNLGKDATVERDVCSLEDAVRLDKCAFVGGNVVATGKLELDKSAVVGGDVTSRDEVRIKQDATVAGNATSAGRVVLQHRAIVEGTITEYATIAPAATIPPVDFTVVPGTVDISIKRKHSETLLPGSYRKLKVENEGAITLTAGVYVFAELEVGHGAVVYLDLNGGALLVDVLGKVGFKDRVRITLLGADDRPSNVLVRALGDDVTLGKEGCYVGTFLAPNAGIELEDDAALNGALYAKTVKTGKGARLAFDPALRLYVDLFVR
jgi:cytoskeletal protein CcmA (bactofilin family)